MHRYDELEKLYYKRKIKKTVFSFVLLIISGFVSYYVYKTYLVPEKKSETPKLNVDIKKIATTQTVEDNENNANNPTINNKKDNNNTAKNSSNTKADQNSSAKDIKKHTKVNNKKTELTPNLSFVVPKIDKKELEKQKKATEKKQQQAKIKKENKSNNARLQVTEQKITAIPSIKEEKININELIETFNKEPKYDTAVVISNYYYNKNDLKNAQLWALKANNIDPSKYQSWKMFAMILLKKNDKIKAKEVLQIYLNDYGENDEIYKLLRSIDE